MEGFMNKNLTEINHNNRQTVGVSAAMNSNTVSTNSANIVPMNYTSIVPMNNAGNLHTLASSNHVHQNFQSGPNGEFPNGTMANRGVAVQDAPHYYASNVNYNSNVNASTQNFQNTVTQGILNSNALQQKFVGPCSVLDPRVAKILQEEGSWPCSSCERQPNGMILHKHGLHGRSFSTNFNLAEIGKNFLQERGNWTGISYFESWIPCAILLANGEKCGRDNDTSWFASAPGRGILAGTELTIGGCAGCGTITIVIHRIADNKFEAHSFFKQQLLPISLIQALPTQSSASRFDQYAQKNKQQQRVFLPPLPIVINATLSTKQTNPDSAPASTSSSSSSSSAPVQQKVKDEDDTPASTSSSSSSSSAPVQQKVKDEDDTPASTSSPSASEQQAKVENGTELALIRRRTKAMEVLNSYGMLVAHKGKNETHLGFIRDNNDLHATNDLHPATMKRFRPLQRLNKTDAPIYLKECANERFSEGNNPSEALNQLLDVKNLNNPFLYKDGENWCLCSENMAVDSTDIFLFRSFVGGSDLEVHRFTNNGVEHYVV
jgi:hypothetical protein